MEDLHQLAAGQGGIVTREQLRDLGVDRHRVRRWMTSERLLSTGQRTFAMPGTPDTFERRAWTALLEIGLDATLSHTTAAAMWRLRGFDPEPIHLVVTRWRRPNKSDRWFIHQFSDLPSAHRHTIDGLPVTSPALTMLHLAPMVGQARLERTIDDAWSRRILSGTDLEDLDAELSRQGRNGLVRLRKAREDRGPDWVPPDSNIEARFMQLTRGLGHDFRRQVPIAGEGWSARVDFLHEPSRTVIEIQSQLHHTSSTDRRADEKRRRRLEDAGFEVVEVWDHELFGPPGAVVDRIAAAIHR